MPRCLNALAVLCVCIVALATPAAAETPGGAVPKPPQCYLITVDTPAYHPYVDVCRPDPTIVP